jgi:hypothetical protein
MPPQVEFQFEGPEGRPDPGVSMPPGLSIHSQSLLNYLPGIYQTDFMSRFLALFESILIPVEWNVDHFDMFLDPGTAPWISCWLENWYLIIVMLPEQAKDDLVGFQIYARRGTRCLSRILRFIWETEITNF